MAQSIILSALKRHRRPLSGDELQIMCQVNRRQVRMAISSLRRNGYLIVGNWGDYHMARNVDEVEAVAVEMERQAVVLVEIAQAMRSAARSDPSLYA